LPDDGAVEGTPTRGVYEQVAGRYDDDRAPFSIPRDDLIAALLASHAPVRVIDLGCGTGRWLAAQLAAFAPPGLRIFGIDPSEAMLGEARAKGLGGLVLGRAEGLPLRDGTVDLVSASFCFHHFEDKEQALDEIARVLAPGGQLRLTNIEPGEPGCWWVHDFFPETVAIDAARFWPPARLGDALEARGLDVEVALDAGRGEIPIGDALAEAERRVVSELALLDDRAYERGLADLRRAAEASAAHVRTPPRLVLTARRTG
jgi:SAM-dependent methyltransferase